MLQKLRNVIAYGKLHREDPEDVAKGVLMIDAIGILLGRGDATMLARMQESELGRRLLEERHAVLDVLTDRDRLRSLPDGTLGREYVRFAEAKQLFPEKLAAIVAEARADSGGFVAGASPEVAYLHDRYRDLHDLWHVVTGYDTDMAGEYGIVAFQSKQVGYRAMAIVGLFSLFFNGVIHGRLDLIGTWFQGRRRGRNAPYLLAQDWDAFVLEPLESVREKLGLSEPPNYRPFEIGRPATESVPAA